MNTREQHEFKICKTILNLSGAPYEISGKPDKEIRNMKAVDFYGTIDEMPFYLEHTLIESYPHQIEDDKQTEFLFGLKEELDGKLPTPGHYKLGLAPNSIRGFKNKRSIKKKLRSWILENAVKLKLGSPTTATNHFIRETPNGLPFEVSLSRFPRHDGKLFISLSINTASLELERYIRIETAVAMKCPKLNKSKLNNKDLSILVLESNDYALANHTLIGEALFKVFSESKSNLIPDKIFLVMTDVNPWNVFIFKERYFDLIS